MATKAQKAKFTKDRTDTAKLLISAIDNAPELTVAQTLCTILRPRGQGFEPYHWTDERLNEEIKLFLASVAFNPLDPIETDY